MRSTLFALAFLSLGCQSRPATPVARADPGYELPSAAAVAQWPIQADQAQRSAIGIMDGSPSPHMEYHTSPILRGGYGLWLIEATSRLAGGWQAEIDARTGRLYSARRLPGR